MPGADHASERAPRRRWVHAIAVLVIVAGAAWTLHGIQWRALAHALAGAQPGWVLAAAVVNVGVLVLHSLRWREILAPLCRRPCFKAAFQSTLVGFSVSYVVPARAGELARMEWVRRSLGLPRAAIATSMLLDALVNAAGFLVGLAVLPLVVPVPPWIPPAGVLVAGIFVAGVITIAATASSRPGRFRRFAGVREGLAAVRKPRRLAGSFAASLVGWGLEVVVILLSLRAVGIAIPTAAALLVLVAVNLALLYPFAPPGNFGTLEIGAVVALVPFGVGKEEALAFALCYHLLQALPIGLAGLAVAGGRDGLRALRHDGVFR